VPSTSVDVVADQLPALSAVVVATVVAPLPTVITAPASEVPERTGVATFVGDAGVLETIDGAAGAVVSITRLKTEEAVETLPTPSVAVAVTE